jgi:hypothetical protein
MRELPLYVNTDVKPKACTACHEMSSFPQFVDRARDTTRARVQIVRVKDEGTMIEELGGKFAMQYICTKCGHLDFYTHSNNDIEP